MKKKFDRSSLMKVLWKLMLPIVLQNLLNAVYCVGKSFNPSLVADVFCAGGDTRFGLVCDAVSMWLVILPLGYLSAFVWSWPPLVVYAVLCMDEFVKLPFAAVRFRQYKWLKNLTDQQGENTNVQNL